MSKVSISWVLGLCFSFAACGGTAAEPPAADATEPTPGPDVGAEDGPGAEGPSGASAPAGGDPSVPADDDDPSAPTGEGDAGPPGDAGAYADAGSPPKHQIPLPDFGKLHASSKTGDLCEFTVNGMAKGTGTVLDIGLVTGTYTVACKRPDGAVASKAAVITKDQTTTTVLEFPANGTLVAVAVNGTCAFSVNGAAKGTTSSLKISLAPGSYLVECKPSGGGATKSRTVTIKSYETAMAMFQL